MCAAISSEQRDHLFAVGIEAGLDHIGSCAARPWTSTRSRLEQRRSDGLAGSMQFTFRNPARSSDPSRILRNATSLIVAGRSYAQDVPTPDALPRGSVNARIARYATADHYGRLEQSLAIVADELRSMGHRAVVVADKNSLVDREAGFRAGIGWFGKNSLLLAPSSGSWFVLGSVVTDASIDHVSVPVADGCGSCSKCIPACPTAAITAPGVVDAQRCLAWLLQAPGSFPVEFREALGDRIYGCDSCQEVCPPNRTVELRSRRTEPWPVEHDPGSWVDACELIELADAQLLERVGRWYIADRDPNVVRRNLLIVLGNSGRGEDQRVVRNVVRYIDDANEVLAEHARWAAVALGVGDRVESVDA